MRYSSTFQCDSFVRGYHVYMNICEPLAGECLKNRKEPINEMDKTAVAVIRINSYSEEVVAEYVQDCIYVPISAPLCFGHLCNCETHQSCRWIRIGDSS